MFCISFFTLYRLFAQATVEFTFTSPPIIELGQNAIYQCSVNDARVSVSWNINGQATIPPNITVNGLGTQHSTLTIPGEIQYNNTLVRCIASEIGDETGYVNFSNSTLLIQGKDITN